ncbi:MAG: hypothetical protein AAGA77_17215 [Bacteroidota bacterium]
MTKHLLRKFLILLCLSTSVSAIGQVGISNDPSGSGNLSLAFDIATGNTTAPYLRMQ